MTVALATDIGGTFTDVVLDVDGRIHVAKTLTTPDDPVDGLLRGVRQVLAEAGVAAGAVRRFVHATTLATNVILERRGAPVAFVTTRGFRSMLALGRRARVEEERYDLAYEPGEPPVPLTHTFEVPERIAANGEVLLPLDEAAAREVAARIKALDVASVAVCLLHAHANDVHERRLAELIDAPVVRSSEIWPGLGEYERATTTLMSAYVGPVMSAYLHRLQDRLRALGIEAPVHVMESAGGMLPAALAARRPVYTIESGPAAGVIAATAEGARHGLADLISFDMGGTTAKAGLVRDGHPNITHDFQVGGKGSYGGRRPGTGTPIKIPAIDLAEVGAGGGSTAWLQPPTPPTVTPRPPVVGGVLRVGPWSVGAVPGPACYGRGGGWATVTDADVVLGYLGGLGEVGLDAGLAEEAIARHVAKPLGVGVVEAAAAIHDIANAQMGAAIHVVTVRRGIDPRGFTLVALGGAAPTHAARLAERFGITRLLVPARCGVGSAVGLLHADLAVERSRTFLSDDPSSLASVLTDLADACRNDLATSAGTVVRSVDIRFVGQAHAFTVELRPGPVTRATIEAAIGDFYARYRESYGIELSDPAELTTARVRLTVPAERTEAAREPARQTVSTTRRAWFDGAFIDVPVRERIPGDRLAGPCIVTEPQASLVIPPGWSGEIDDHGAALLERTAR